MLNNYPNRSNKQHEHQRFDYKEYLDTSSEQFDVDVNNDISAEVAIEMSNSIYDMRREFKRTVKELRKLYKSKEPKKPEYEYKAAKLARINIAKHRAIS